ncbi:hypothetical protein TrVFT333_002398 [Trichoderma virens FT-333]|nr:hypothetical protein TrVFT333_002398 [Trichoderma virens FT-333]
MDTVVPSVGKITSHRLGDDQSRQLVTEVEYSALENHVLERVTDAPRGHDLEAYLEERPSNNKDFNELLLRTLVVYSPLSMQASLKAVLSTLNTRAGSLLLTGSITPFYLQSIANRTSILNAWRTSRFASLQVLFKQMTLLGKNTWIKTSPTVYRMIRYPEVPPDHQPGNQYEFQFLQLPPGSDTANITTEILIIGSGCGAGVCAKNLAESGHSVLVVDKGYHFTSSYFPMSESAGFQQLFENGGTIQSDDGSIATQDFVRKEWAEEKGLEFFTSEKFQESLDRVCERMGVTADGLRHNHGNRVLMEASRRLGAHVKAAPQNIAGGDHLCGRCTLGCASAEKQGPAITWLPDAAKAGATFMEGLQVGHVLFDDSKSQKTVIGAKGVWTSNPQSGKEKVTREVAIHAKKVIVSCGSLWSPIVLLNSNLKNKHIGQNLHLHPVNFVTAVHKSDVRPWEGPILTVVDSSLENLDGHGHGTKLEASCMLPSLALSFLNWSTGLDFKAQVLKYRHSNSYISLTRDRDPGCVYSDPQTGKPRIRYTPSNFDRRHTMEGVIALATRNFICGAEEIHVGFPGVQPFVRHPDPSFPLSFESQSPSPPKVTKMSMCGFLLGFPK